MRPKPIRPLSESEAERFIEIDQRPVRPEDIEATKKSVEVFLSMEIKE
ncbi:MAG: hypothetical protein ACOC56_05935 [Atribacterota bacterium]